MKISAAPIIVKYLKLIGKMADKENCAVFVVGGFVRDALIGVKNFDVDVLIERDAIGFSRAFADSQKAKLIIHKRFKTATVFMPGLRDKKNNFKIDFATARREHYKHPAALPDVEFGSLKDDLFRRDFTINAMAIGLNKENFGKLIDFFGGKKDLEKGIISRLHEKSFVDDPTRIFRAIRFEQRFGFRIDEPTERLIRVALKKGMLRKTTKTRIHNELILILKEDKPLQAIKRMYMLEGFKFLHPGIKMSKRSFKLFDSIDAACKQYALKKRTPDTWLIYLMPLFEGLDVKSIKALCKEFSFRRPDTTKIVKYMKNGRKALKFLSQDKRILPSSIYKKLYGFSEEMLFFMIAKTKSKKAKTRLRNFIFKYNKIKIKANGNDLKKIGFTPGPRLGSTLKRILYAKLDGKVRTKKQELVLALSFRFPSS